MNNNNISKLLDSFYNGQTTTEENLLLLNYFNNTDNLPEELQEEKEIFLLLNSNVTNEIVVPSNLENRLANLIDTLAEQEEATKTSTKKRNLIQWIAVAASVAILIFAGVNFSDTQIEGDNSNLAKAVGASQQLTEQEYIEVEAAVQLLAFNFNKGLEQLDGMNENLDKTTEILNKTFNQKSK